ncbi:MAG TPA: carboxypeptidase regulatory-like domain-containing protein [Candidatus Polarisedimenticolia bacterium]|nr:carboxypeptidase regulatory-like domain-containing protein [Candidatus Polarisedimenticolia bacterium]
MSRRSARVVLLLSLLFAGPAFGASGELKGNVVDGSGAPLPGVTVVVWNPALGVAERGGVTDAAGSFRIIGLSPGPGYRLRASLSGFAPIEFSDLDVADGQARFQNVTLRPASELKETVRVQGKTDVVNPESVTTSTTFSSEFIAGLPVLGRDYQDILSLAPGVTDVNGTGNPNIHGARDTDVLTLVDGVNTTDPFSGYYGQQLNIESIQEIEVITSGSRAEFGRAQGGFVNIVTKSGGNEFKGTFKFYLRSHRLDGDGAGAEDPEVVGGIGETEGFRDLRFTDLYPYLSLSGAFIKDKLWYFFSSEYVQIETPIDSLAQAFVVSSYGYRVFGKTTWQINPANKMALSLTLDRTKDENQGLTSLANVESGYSFKRGGPTFTLKEVAVFTPSLFLDSSVSWFDNNFRRSPTTDPDTNHNGILYVDAFPALGGNQDGIVQARERDPGEDFDRDFRYDLFEDEDENGVLAASEDRDLDGRLTGPAGCEGTAHEDRNCNGALDEEVDANHDGIAQPSEDRGIPCSVASCPGGFLPDTAGNGRIDSEDANGNGRLDVLQDSGQTPFPLWHDSNDNGSPDPGEFRSPLEPDRDYFRDSSGRITGPNPYELDDHRTRLTLKEELSLYLGDFLGTHDLKMGADYEAEGYQGTETQRANLRAPRARVSSSILTGGAGSSDPQALTAFVGAPVSVDHDAEGVALGLYLQDTYKPIPNLTLGLGVRLDLEDVSAFGYSFFDPAEQRRQYNDIVEVTGVDVSPDGIQPLGLCSDPLYSCDGSGLPLHVASLYSSLRNLAPQRFSRHNSEVDILSPYLAGVLGGEADINALQAQGFNIRRKEKIRIQNTNLSPHLSLSWDPWADGKSKGFASWGRYYGKLFLNTVVLEQGPDSVARFYSFDRDGVDVTGRPDNQFGAVRSQSAPSAFQVDRSLSTPYTVEFTLGFQREIAPEISLGVTLVHRDYKDQLQDIDVNHYTVRDPNTGRFVDLLGDEILALGLGKEKPVSARIPDGIPDLYIQNIFFNRIFRLGNYNDQTYRGVELELVKRLSRKWEMNASYTYSQTKGDAESFLSENGDDPSLAEFEPGYLDYDQTHVLKLNATSFLPGDWRLGGTIIYASGLPFSVIQETEANDDVGYVQARKVFGYYDRTRGFVSENRNTHRNHASYLVNARTEKAFVIGKASASAFFEIFNLLNTDDLRIYSLDSGLVNLNINGVRSFGRRYQVGIQINF